MLAHVDNDYCDPARTLTISCAEDIQKTDPDEEVSQVRFGLPRLRRYAKPPRPLHL